MAKLNWYLFDRYIVEDITDNISQRQDSVAKDSVEKTYSQTISQEEDNFFSISAAIRDAYYITALKQIHTNFTERPNIDLKDKLAVLNDLDRLLSVFVNQCSGLLYEAEEEYSQITDKDIPSVSSAVYDYCHFILRFLKSSQKATEPSSEFRHELNKLSADVLATSQESLTNPKSFSDFSEFLAALNEKVCNYDFSKSARTKIYIELNNIPDYLGNPYSKRYQLYKYIKSFSKNKKMNLKRISPILDTLLFQKKFSTYCSAQFQNVANYISNTQNAICQRYYFDLDSNEFSTVCRDLIDSIKSMPCLNKQYKPSSLHTRCFSLANLYLSNEKSIQHITFSGVFDSDNITIQNSFKKHPPLKKAIEEMAAAWPTSVLVKTNPDVRYYYQSSSNQNQYLFITVSQACQVLSNDDLNQNSRMFTCCEKKLLSELEKIPKEQVLKCTIYVKYECCNLCRIALNEFCQSNYNINVIAGMSHSPVVANQNKYDQIAQSVHTKIIALP